MIKKPTGIIFDLDGVLVDSSKRFQRIDLDAFQRRDKDKFVQSLRNYLADCESVVFVVVAAVEIT